MDWIRKVNPVTTTAMKKPQLFFGLVLVATIVSLVLLRFVRRDNNDVAQQPPSPSSVVSHGSSPELTNENTPSGSMPSQKEIIQAQKRGEARLAEMGITPGMSEQQIQAKMVEWAKSQREKIADSWRKPINFYGEVLDQSNQPIQNVKAHLVWTDTSTTGSSESDRFSDTKGQFNLVGVTGKLLQVWLSKEGYYVPKTNQIDFDYSEGFLSFPDNPVAFRLVKKGDGADLITSAYGVFRTLDFSAPRDGIPIRVDFFGRKTGAAGQMEVRQVKPTYETLKTSSGWSYWLAILDGGFVEHNDEFPFSAPESGYQPVVEFNFRKGEPNWMTSIEKNYYISFGNPRKYGRIRVETSMTTGTILEYAINPDGSRNLEPKN
jgi:hypothetical protein